MGQPFRSAGWLSPAGRFYPCEPGKHEELAERLNRFSSKGLEQAGWIRILKPQLGKPLSNTIIVHHLIVTGKGPTRAQLRWLWEYFHAWGADEDYDTFCQALLRATD